MFKQCVWDVLELRIPTELCDEMCVENMYKTMQLIQCCNTVGWFTKPIVVTQCVTVTGHCLQESISTTGIRECRAVFQYGVERNLIELESSLFEMWCWREMLGIFWKEHQY